MSEKVVVCVSEPEVAITVAVEVPAGIGLGLAEPVMELPHPLRKTRMNRMDKVPLPTERSLGSLAASAALATGLQDRRAISLLTRPMHAPEGDSVRSGVRT